MVQLLPVASDIVAVTILAGALYFRRYHRRDLLFAYVSLNLGVLAVTWVLVSSGAGPGLGIDLVHDITKVDVRYRAAR